MVDGIDVDGDRDLWGVNQFFDLTSGGKALVKVIKAFISWADVFGFIDKKHDEPFARTYQCMDITKKVILGIEIPGKVEALVRSSIEVVKDVKAKATGTDRADGKKVNFVNHMRDVVSDVTNLWNSVQETMELLWLNMSKDTAMLLEKIGGVALDVGMSCLIWKDVSDISKKMGQIDALRVELKAEKEKGDGADAALITRLKKDIEAITAQGWNKVIRVAQWTSYLVLGALIIATAFFAASLAPWMMLACSTAALAFSIASHFHSVHFVDPLFKAPELKHPERGMTAKQLFDFDARGYKLPKAAERRLKDDLLDDTARPDGLPDPRADLRRA